MSSSSRSPIIVHHLQDSRSQRILWLLEELQVPYEIKRYERVKGLAPPELKQVHPLGKSPVITDNGQTIAETAIIVDYLIEKYDTKKQFQPKGEAQVKDNQFWEHWAEGSAIAPLVIALVMQNIDEQTPWPVKPIAWAITSQVKKTFLFPNIKLNFEYIEAALQKSGGPWLQGGNITGGDIMMSFPAEAAASHPELIKFVGAATRKYVETIHARPAYQRALEKGGDYSYATTATK